MGTPRPWRTPQRQFENYKRLGGYAGLRKALAITADEMIAMVQEANRSRRGTGGTRVTDRQEVKLIPRLCTAKPAGPYLVLAADDGGQPCPPQVAGVAVYG